MFKHLIFKLVTTLNWSYKKGSDLFENIFMYPYVYWHVYYHTALFVTFFFPFFVSLKCDIDQHT